MNIQSWYVTLQTRGSGMETDWNGGVDVWHFVLMNIILGLGIIEGLLLRLWFLLWLLVRLLYNLDLSIFSFILAIFFKQALTDLNLEFPVCVRSEYQREHNIERKC